MLKRKIALLLSIIMFLSIIEIDVSIAQGESLETRASSLLQGVTNDSAGKNIVKSVYGIDYELNNGKLISYSILRDYELKVYIYPYEDTSSYKGFGELKNKEYRHLGYTKDGAVVTNPRYMDDATSSVNLKDKGWYEFNPNRTTYDISLENQYKYLFNATLYDPVGTNNRPLNMSVKDILSKRLTSFDDLTIQKYSQMGSPPTLNNEGSIMLMHETKSGGRWYDTFISMPLDLGARYKSTIGTNKAEYVFKKDANGNLQEVIDATVTVVTEINFSKSEVELGYIYPVLDQEIEFKGEKSEVTIQNNKFVQTFPIKLYAKDFKFGETTEVPISADTHLLSLFKDQKTVKAEGSFKVTLDAPDIEADFNIMKGDQIVTDSVFTIGQEVERISEDESDKEVVKRLDMSVDLKLVPKIDYDPSLVKILGHTWLVEDRTQVDKYDFISNQLNDVVLTINKDNVDQLVDDEGNINVRLYVQAEYGKYADVSRDTNMQVKYKNEPLTPKNLPPVAKINSKERMKAGSTTSFSGLKSYDEDGYITDYKFNGYGGFRIINTNSKGSSGYGTPLSVGNNKIKLQVTDDAGLTDTKDFIIDAMSPIEHNEIFRGSHKVNRKITLDSTRDRGTTYYPSSKFNTTWTIEPLQGQDINSIKWDTDNEGNLVNVLFKQQGIYNITKTVKANCTFPGDEDLNVVETVTRGIKIHPDEEPVAQFALVKYNIRQMLDDGYSTVKVYDTSYSPDMDKLYKRAWYYRYDSDNDGIFTDEAYKLIDNVNDLKEVNIRVKDVGRYEFRLTLEEDFTDQTIPRFLSPEDILKDDTDDIALEEKVAEVLNVAPVVKLEEKPNKKVEMILLTDYIGSDRANLESEIQLLSKNMQEKKLNLISHNINVNLDSNGIVVGKREVPVYSYYRRVALNLYYDSYYRQSFLTGKETREYPGILSYSQNIESYNMTENEAKNLPSYPLAYTNNYYMGYSYNTENRNSNFRRLRGGSLDVYDEGNLLRKNVKFTDSLFLFTNSVYGNWGVADHGTYSYQGGTMRRMEGYVDKDFVRGKQVGSKFEDIRSFDLDKIKNIELDKESEKYLLILTNNSDSTKSLDSTFLSYLKENGFKVRVSMPGHALDSTLEGSKISDIRFTDSSILLRTKYNNYYEMGNNNTPDAIVFANRLNDPSKIDLFKKDSYYKNFDELTAVKSFDLKTYVYLYVRRRSRSNYLMGDSKIEHRNDKSVYFNGEKILDNVDRMYASPIGVILKTSDSVKLYYASEASNLIIDSYYGHYWYQHVDDSAISNLTYSLVDLDIKDLSSVALKEEKYEDYFEGVGNSNVYKFTLLIKGDNKLYKYIASSRFNNNRLPYQVNSSVYNNIGFNYDDLFVYNNKAGDEIYLENDKAYYTGSIFAYIKDGLVYAKGDSSMGQLGLVKSNVDAFRKIFNNGISIEKSLVFNQFIEAAEVLYDPSCKRFSDESQVFTSMLSDFKDYSTEETIYKLVGEELQMDTFYFDYESDPLEDTKYEYLHEEIFDNSLGLDPLHGTSTRELVKIYNKVGKYTILPRYRDNPKDDVNFMDYWLWNQDNTNVNLIVHRKPLAVASYKSKKSDQNSYQITLKGDQSYDLDHSSKVDKGIVQWQWTVQNKESLESKNYTGKEINIKKYNNEKLRVFLRIKDLEGQWSDYVLIDLDYINSMELDFNIRSSSDQFSILSIPISEPIDIYDIRTLSDNPVDIEFYVEDGLGNREALFSRSSHDDSNNLKSGLILEELEEAMSISWQDENYTINNKFNDGVYSILLRAVDKTNPNIFIEKRADFNVNTPIDLRASVPNEIVSGENYMIEASASKYTDTINMKVYDRLGEKLMDLPMTYSSQTSNSRKVFKANVSADIFKLEGNIRFDFKATVDTETPKSERLILNSKYVDLALVDVKVYGDWNRWDGKTDLRGRKLEYNPYRFLSFERIYIEARTRGNPDKLYLDLSDELKAMEYKDDKGNKYKYSDFTKYEVQFPLEFIKVEDNYWKIDYILPLADSTISIEDNRLREPYFLSVKAKKGISQAIYTIDKDSEEGGIEITGNIYDHFYIQKK